MLVYSFIDSHRIVEINKSIKNKIIHLIKPQREKEREREGECMYNSNFENNKIQKNKIFYKHF